mgnify:CR=1 FL=1
MNCRIVLSGYSAKRVPLCTELDASAVWEELQVSLKVIASMSIAVCMGFVYNQSAEGIGTVMRITVASGVILI